MKRSQNHYYDTEVDFGDQVDVPVTCVYTWYKGWKGGYEGGMKIEPDEPAEANIMFVTDGNGEDVYGDLPEDLIETLEERCADHYNGLQEAGEEARADSIREHILEQRRESEVAK